MFPDPTPTKPDAAVFRRHSRSAGLLTEKLNHPTAAWISVAAHRMGWTPAMLTGANLVIGVVASVGVIALAEPLANGVVPAWLVGLGAWLLWQLAYTFDCADGQLARVTAVASPAGGRMDIFCDIAVQITLVSAVGAVSEAAWPRTPAWLVGVFASSWMLNLVTSVMSKEGASHSLVNSTSIVVRLAKLVRDYSFMTTVIAAVIAVRPALMTAVMIGFSIVNIVFLLAAIGQPGRASMRDARLKAETPPVN